MLFSVIIPVYNVEKYLAKCMDSVLNQDFDDFEVILIDDGSTDNSGALCDEYEKKDERVVVIHKKNGGLSSARNAGMNRAKGEYIIFIDSDDWVDTDGFSALSQIIQRDRPEVVETCVIEEDGDETRPTDLHFADYLQTRFSRERALYWMSSESENAWPAWKRVCNREFLLKNDLYFAEGRLQEDLDWSTRLFYFAKKFSGYAKPWYHYRLKREGSITNSIKAKYITDSIEMAAIDRKYRDSNDKYSVMVFNKLICAVYANINLYKNCSKSDQEKVRKCIEDNKWLFDYTPQFKYKLFAASARVMGVGNALRLLSLV